MGWRDALLRLHNGGWNADDIDKACATVHDACDEGKCEGTEVGDLTLTQLRSVLHLGLDEHVLRSLQTIAALRRCQDHDAEELRRALYDLDAFAYDFGDD
jgi:hypothetical protein